MDIYITDNAGPVRVAIPMLPEKISRKGSARTQGYDIINVGEVQLPGGSSLLTYSWNGTFPGESRKNASHIKRPLWQHPKELEQIFEKWRVSGARLILMVTETPINCEVLLTKFDTEYSGGNGDIAYTVTFTQSKRLIVQTMQEAQNSSEDTTRPEAAAAQEKTYTVVSGDTLWSIAERFLGNGARYPEIYNLNKEVVGSDPRLLKPGLVLTLP